ncbi:MAG: DUF1499 domain-containing protein [Gammaproteobacteria bacterium]
MLWGLAVGVLVVVVAFAVLGWWSRQMDARAPGVVDGALAACAAAPNCVCSEVAQAGDATHHVAPLALPPGAPEARWDAVVAAVRDAGGRIVSERDGYLHAVFRTPLFGFADDVELRLDGDAVHWRSASRVGHSDLGANRRRLEALRGRIKAAVSAR